MGSHLKLLTATCLAEMIEMIMLWPGHTFMQLRLNHDSCVNNGSIFKCLVSFSTSAWFCSVRNQCSCNIFDKCGLYTSWLLRVWIMAPASLLAMKASNNF